MANRRSGSNDRSDFIFLGSKITVCGDCSHEIKKKKKNTYSLKGKPRQCIKKMRYHCAEKGPYTQAMVFPVVANRCASCSIKKTEF